MIKMAYQSCCQPSIRPVWQMHFQMVGAQFTCRAKLE